jgi:hypothetical protein
MKWEYRVVKINPSSHLGTADYLTEDLNDLGAEGWEAVSSWANPVGVFVLLKRKKSE